MPGEELNIQHEGFTCLIQDIKVEKGKLDMEEAGEYSNKDRFRKE